MKTATVSEFRYRFAQLSKWLEAGETVQILKDGQPWARVEPEENIAKPPAKEREKNRKP